MVWDQVATDEVIEKTAKALESNGIRSFVVSNGEEAKSKAIELIPEGSEVMTMTSVTLETIGLDKIINESGKYVSARTKLASMDQKTQAGQMRGLRTVPQYTVGSVHAVTEDGHVLIASQSGSQLPAYVFGSQHVIWVVGAQKIVKNTDEGIKRIYEHCLPLEDARAQKAYGVGSAVNKLLIINRETIPNRITTILVKEKLGF